MQEFENNNDEIEIDLVELFFALKRKVVAIVVSTLVFAVLAGGITKFAITPMYSSSAQLYVLSKQGISQLTDLTMGTQLTQDYMIIAKTRPVLERTIEELNLKLDYKELGNKVTVTNESDTRIMKITVTDADPQVAQQIAQKLSEVTAETVASKMDVKKPTIIENAYEAENPDSPSMKKNVVIGAALGFLLACGIVVVQFMLNDTICKEEDIEKYLGINTLAKLPLEKGEKKRTKKEKGKRR